jgi:hypothetical protein
LAGTLSCWSRLHLQSLAPTNPHWICVVSYDPVSLCVSHKKGLCPISGGINWLMMVTVFRLQRNTQIRAYIATDSDFVLYYVMIMIKEFSQLRNNNEFQNVCSSRRSHLHNIIKVIYNYIKYPTYSTLLFHSCNNLNSILRSIPTIIPKYLLLARSFYFCETKSSGKISFERKRIYF